MRILVSACLLGQKVRYDGGHQAQSSAILQRWLAEKRVVPVCPEVLGGLPVPRPPAEIAQGAGGRSVLNGDATVITANNDDVTAAFVAGARAALHMAKEQGAVIAVLKEGSPSCGSYRTYDGSFSGRSISQSGVSAALLEQHDLHVFNELQWQEADAFLLNCESKAQACSKQ